MISTKQFSIVFNAAKSACLLVASSKSLQQRVKKPEFYISGKLIDFVNEYTHLRHIISDCMDDKHDILFRRNTLCGKINNVTCFFCQQCPAVKLRLMCRYCSDHYGGVLWDLNNPSAEDSIQFNSIQFNSILFVRRTRFGYNIKTYK